MRLLKGCGKKVAALVCGLMLAGLAGVAQGSIMSTQTYNGINGDGSENWMFEYLVTNTTPSVTLDRFEVVFTPYASFVSPTPLPDRTGWDVVIVNDDLNLTGKTYVAGAQTGNGIAYNTTASGFFVPFVYYGDSGGATLPQSFTEYYSDNTSQTGFTTTTTVPEPSTYLLSILALAAVAASRKLLNRRMANEG